jgi:hypothetical protein
MEKTCIKCDTTKSLEDFEKRTDYDAYRNVCKACQKIQQYEYRQKNKEKVKKRNEKWRKENKDKVDIICARYRKTEKRRKISREWAIKPENRQKSYDRRNYRYHNDIQFNLKIKLRRRIHSSLSQRLISKSATSIKLLGCSYMFLKEYIENKFTEGMTWEKVLSSEIHLDHILPCDSFDLTDKIQQQECFHYTNLQPLWAFDNLSKSNKI